MKRIATHAGSWYTSDKNDLNDELEFYFEKATKATTLKDVRAIIGPHAGFTYSGPTAAFAYKLIDVSNIKRVFLLGPSHHVYIDGCSLSKCDIYETPFGNMNLDKEVLEELYSTGRFEWMGKSVDEDEHSIEMHLPFTYKIFEDKINNVKLVPILVGSITSEKEKMYGEMLSKYLEDSDNLFIISSDFCHWGARFGYTYYTKSDSDDPIELSSDKGITRPIYESIQSLDFEAIQTIKENSFSKFQRYLQRTDNTICGRHPIAILLAALEDLRQRNSNKQLVKCIKYDQSSHCKRFRDSSVSYASIYVQIQD